MEPISLRNSSYKTPIVVKHNDQGYHSPREQVNSTPNECIVIFNRFNVIILSTASFCYEKITTGYMSQLKINLLTSIEQGLEQN